MADKLTRLKRSLNMAAIGSKDTKPEMVVRKLSHSLGFRYRLHQKNLPGNPDLVFPKYRAVIFVHGCFWHRHPSEGCLDSRMPKSNVGYWSEKLARNATRDAENYKKLAGLGWRVFIVWECETKTSAVLKYTLKPFYLAIQTRRKQN